MNITIITRSDFKKIKAQLNVQKTYHHTPAGILEVSSTEQGIHKAAFVDSAPQDSVFSSDLMHKFVFVGSPLQIKVWEALLEIPHNKTMTYQELAQHVGHPHAWRAIANAVARNNIAFFVPCHRIIKKNGDVGGYKWGEERKMLLLNAEKL